MSERVWARVQRSGQGANMTDQTAVVIWSHEVPILEEIHGEGSVTVLEDPQELVDASVRAGTDKDGTKINRSVLIERRIKELGLGEKFSTDPMEEYSRLAAVYGMHDEVKMPVVQVVYGRFDEGRFVKAIGVEALEDLTIQELRTRASKLELEFSPKDKKTDLIEAIRAFTTDTAQAQEIRERHDRLVA